MVNKSMSNLGTRLDNSGAKPLQTNNQNPGMVGPGGVPAANAFKGLEWQTERSAHLGAKEHFRPLANRSMPASKQAGGALRRFSSRRAQAPENSIIRRPGARCCSVWQQPATTVEPYRAPFEETSR
jgi:hypothetical protein